MERQTRDFAHLQTVGWPLLRDSVGLCGEHVAPSVAVFAANAYYFKNGEARETAVASGYGEIVTTYAVIDGTPASTAGLQVGDELVAVDGWQVPTGDKATAAVVKHI
jgi:S1-C subfamily serine protease